MPNQARPILTLPRRLKYFVEQRAGRWLVVHKVAGTLTQYDVDEDCLTQESAERLAAEMNQEAEA